MPSASIDKWIAINQRVPGELYALSAASPLNATAGSTSKFRGVFVDTVGGSESEEPWDIKQSEKIKPEQMARFREQLNDRSIVEYGAIAIAATVLEARSSLRIGNVHKVGTFNDYALVDAQSRPAGVIEFKGVTSRYTSDVAAGAREQVGKATLSPKRIGVVAFGRPEVRHEVVG